MKVLISVFQVFVMGLVGLFAIGAIEVVSYRTINKPLALELYYDKLEGYELAVLNPKGEIFEEEHWGLRFAQSNGE